MASKGPKSGKPAPAVAKPTSPVVKAPVEAAKAVAESVIEKKKPAPKAPVAAKPAPAPVQPAPIAAAAPIVDAVTQTAEKIITQAAEAPKAVPVAEVVEAMVPEAAVPATPLPEPIVPETTAPAAVEPAPVINKEASMYVDNTNAQAAQAKTLFTDFNDRAKAAVEKSTKAVEEFNDFAKGNVEALVESSKITAKGLEALGQDAAEYSRRSFETATAALKNLAAAKSPTDFFKLQSDFLRGAFDSYVAEASKATEAVIKLAGEAAQPISSRVALAAEKAKIAA